MQTKKIIVQKNEKTRLKKIKKYQKQGVQMSEKDQTPIVDPKVE